MSVGGNKWSCLRFQEKFGTQNLELGMSSPSHPIPFVCSIPVSVYFRMSS